MKVIFVILLVLPAEVDQLIFESPLPAYLMGREKVKPQTRVKSSKVPGKGTEKKEKKSPIVSSTNSRDKDKYRKTTDKIDEEETERIKSKLQKELDIFMKDRKLTWMKFPTSLSSKDRFLVHEVSVESKCCTIAMVQLFYVYVVFRIFPSFRWSTF